MAQKINFQAQVENIKNYAMFELLNLLNHSNNDDILLTKMFDENGQKSLFYSKNLINFANHFNNNIVYRLVKDDEYGWLCVVDSGCVPLDCQDKYLLETYPLPNDINQIIKLYERVYNIFNVPNFIEESYKEEIEEEKKYQLELEKKIEQIKIEREQKRLAK